MSSLFPEQPWYPVGGSQTAPGVAGPVHQNGAPPAPPWGRSPAELYGYIMAQVPGISQQGASWLQAQLLGGGSIGADPLSAQLNGLTLAQLNSIMGLQPFAGGAPTNVYGPAGPSGGHGDFGTGSPGHGGFGTPPSTDVSGIVPRPIHTPPAENTSVPQNTPGFPNYPGQPPYVGGNWAGGFSTPGQFGGGPVYGPGVGASGPQAVADTKARASETAQGIFDQLGHHGMHALSYPVDPGGYDAHGVPPVLPGVPSRHIGEGAAYAESYLHTPNVLDNSFDGAPSPVKYLGQRKRFQY